MPVRSRVRAFALGLLVVLLPAVVMAETDFELKDLLLRTQQSASTNARLGEFPEMEYPSIDVTAPTPGDTLRNDEIVNWVYVADRKINSLKGDAEALKKKVADLEQQIAALKKSAPVAPTPGGGAGPAAAAIEARFASLEARLAKLEAERNTVRAPFTVTGAGGKPVLQVRPDGIVMFGSGRSTALIDVGASGPARFGLQSGSGTIEMSAQASGAKLEVFNGAAQVNRIVATAQEHGFTVERNGQDAAALSAIAARPVALRVFGQGGKTLAAMGENPATAGTGIVYVGNGSRNASALAANADGSGVVHAFAADGSVGSGLIGKDRMVAAYNATGAAVVTIGKSEQSEGGNVTARDPTGNGVFRAGYAVNGGGEACVYRVKRQNTFCLGIPFH